MKKLSIVLVFLLFSSFAVAQSGEPVAVIDIEGNLEENNTLTLDSTESQNATLQRWYFDEDLVDTRDRFNATFSGSGEIEVTLEVENSEGLTDSTTETIDIGQGDNPLNDIRLQVAIGLGAVLLLGLAVVVKK